MARKPHVMTAARWAALKKAQERARIANTLRGNVSRNRRRRHYSKDPAKRGQGIAGLKKNFVPYARLNKNSGTGGFNVGTVIPGTGARIAIGGYSRIETMRRKNSFERMISRKSHQWMPNGTKRGSVRNFWNKNVFFDKPTVRANIKGAQVRLGTSRRGGPTIIVRKGNHKVVDMKTFGGTRRYDKRMRTINRSRTNKKSKKQRAQRRGKR